MAAEKEKEEYKPDETEEGLDEDLVIESDEVERELEIARIAFELGRRHKMMEDPPPEPVAIRSIRSEVYDPGGVEDDLDEEAEND